MKRVLSLLLAVSLLLVSAMSVTAAEGEEPTVELVEVAQGKPCFTNWQYNDLLTDYATDGDERTAFANSRGNAWFYVDLGAPHMLEQVKVLMADMGDPTKRCVFDVYLYKTRPQTGNTETGEGTDRVKIHRQAEDPGWKEYFVIDVPEEAKTEAYQYISFEYYEDEEQPELKNTGLSISEIKAYVKAENVVADETHWVEVGRNKAIFANTASEGAEAWKINDGALNTFWANRGVAGYAIRVVVDLGAAMPIAGFVYLPRWDFTGNYWDARGFEIYGSNDRDLVDKTLLYAADPQNGFKRDQLNLIEVDEEKTTDTYRYIVVQKSQKYLTDAQQANGKDPKVTEDFAIAHLSIYSTSDYADAIAEGKTASKRSYEVSLHKKVTATAAYANMNPAPVVGNQYYNWGGWASAGSEKVSAYLYVDLGQPTPVDYVAMASGIGSAGQAKYRKDMKIVGTNDPGFAPENDDVLYEIGETYGAPGADSGLVVFKPDEAFQNKKYRYVGVRRTAVPPSEDTFMDLQAFHVYTNADKFDAIFEPMTATLSGNRITVQTNAVLSKAQTYRILVGCYDSADNLLAVKVETVLPSVGTRTVISKNIDFDAAVIENTAYAKAMLWSEKLAPAQSYVQMNR